MRGRLIILAALFAVSLFRVMYSGERLLLWLMLLIAAVVVLALLNAVYTVIFIDVSQRVIPEILTSGNFGTLSVGIRNRGPFPFAHLEVRYDTFDSLNGGSETESAVFSVMPGQTVGLRREIFFPYRGLYRPGITSIELRDIFGLFRFRMPSAAYSDKQSAVVLPQSASPALALRGENYVKDGVRGGRGDAEKISIAEIRGFRRGDPLKNIHWKLSAKTASLQVKEFDGAVSPSAGVYVDLSPHGLFNEDALAFENCVCMNAAAVCGIVLDSATPLRLTAFSEARTEIEGISGLPRILRFLAEAEFGCRYTFSDILRSEIESGVESDNLIVVTGEYSAELCALLSAFALRGLTVTLIAVSKNRESEPEVPYCAGVTVVTAIPEILRPPVDSEEAAA
ncbi:MAG: DUF58 domain-containing protein [Oscillospiraceae bacterium]|jgi:uncharacterized protein (DUF58 family)|nr:DUF58 domain-containing protein [Oscillospiraceae bacterium]